MSGNGHVSGLHRLYSSYQVENVRNSRKTHLKNREQTLALIDKSGDILPNICLISSFQGFFRARASARNVAEETLAEGSPGNRVERGMDPCAASGHGRPMVALRYE
jgi:hypothetical protein